MRAGAELYAGRLWQMTVSEWKLREQSTVFGFLWTLLQPALMFVVLYGLFTKWMGNRVPSYPIYLLIGIVQYGFFSAATTYGLDSLRRRSGVLLNFVVPRETLVLSAVLSVAASFLIELALMLLFALVLGARPSAAWLALPAIVGALLVLVVGLSLLLAVAAARWHDFPRVWGILTTAGFFLTPIFYTLESISPGRRSVLWLNPMTHVIEMTRACVLGGKLPSAFELGMLAVAAGVVAAAGFLAFKKVESRLADFIAA